MQEFKMDKVFSPQDVETRIYEKWESSGAFKPVIDPEKQPFTIVMPPPNITGQLHVGHALDEMPQDVLIRYHRMKGDPTLWVPGTDHASIATEIKVVEALKAEGISKEDIGREKFLERAWAWKKEYGGRIVRQLRKLGVSCDWSRERFTMDEGLSRAVRETFVRLYEKGLIYRGARIINWCPTCKTALSDAEVEYVEQDSHLWHIRYPGAHGDIVVATTRPETMLGDTGVCVNPADERYKDMVGKTVTLPLMDREIPIVADDYADLEFGTGAVKMTPAHDPNDFEVAQRHDLPIIRVLNDDGTMNENAGKFAGMTREACREAVVEELKKLGLLVKIEPLTHNVGTCYRCHDNVEPLVSTQWFVKMKPLAEPAIEVAKNKELIFVPERFEKTYLNWMENIRDWCISRQLWWGHRIPAFYCEQCGEITVSREDITTCPKCGGHVHQDEDVLDTWFSSALWPFSTLGWPEETEDLKYFYPNSVLSCGYDIIFFWLARMVFSGIEQMGKCPFHVALMHGLVRDAQGRKMSKSLGNGIDPLEMIDRYGSDALRMNMLTSNSPGNDMRFYIERCEAMRNFANKLWNASRYVMMNLSIDKNELPALSELETSDKWILSKLNTLIADVTENLDKYELGVAVQKIYDFIWDSYCDWYIELTKARLYGEDEAQKRSAQQVLLYVLDQILRLMHPFMPFITEEIWQAIPHEGEALIVAAWPKYREDLCFQAEEDGMESIMQAIRAVRNRRAEMNVPPARRTTLYIVTEKQDLFSAGIPFITRLAYAERVVVLAEEPEGHGSMVSCVTHDAKLFLPMEELVDVDKELARIAKEKEKVQKGLAGVQAKLGNPGFAAKAPEQVVRAEQEKAEKYAALLHQLEESEARLKDL